MLIKTGCLNKQNNTNMNTGTPEKKKETGGETDINMCSLSASTSIINNNDKSSNIKPR